MDYVFRDIGHYLRRRVFLRVTEPTISPFLALNVRVQVAPRYGGAGVRMPGNGAQISGASAVLACALVMPSLLLGAGLATSLASGTIFTALFAIGVAVAQAGILTNVTRSLTVAPILLLLISAHFAIASMIVDVDYARGLSSIVAFGILVVGAGAVADVFENSNPLRLYDRMRWFFFAMLALGLWGVIGVMQPQVGSSKPVFPFKEPSHFALMFVPILLFVCATASRYERLCFLAFGFALGLLLENFTLIIGCLLASIITCRPSHLFLLGGVSVPLLLLLDLSYYRVRVTISEDAENLSALVYLQGWQLIAESWSTTTGLGRGFQQLGLHNAELPATTAIDAIEGGEGVSRNLLDGGLTISKLIGEFGLLGVAIVFLFFGIAIRGAILIRRVSLGQRTFYEPKKVLAASIIVSYILDLFVRGTGYFAPTVLLLLSAIFLWSRRRQGYTFMVSATPIKSRRKLPRLGDSS